MQVYNQKNINYCNALFAVSLLYKEDTINNNKSIVTWKVAST